MKHCEIKQNLYFVFCQNRFISGFLTLKLFYTPDVQEQQLKLADKLKERREAQQRKLAAQQEKEREQFVKKADKVTNPGDVSEVSRLSNSSLILCYDGSIYNVVINGFHCN